MKISDVIEDMSGLYDASIFPKSGFDKFAVGVEGAWKTYGEEVIECDMKKSDPITSNLSQKRPDLTDGVPRAVMLEINFSTPAAHWAGFNVSDKKGDHHIVDLPYLDSLISDIRSAFSDISQKRAVKLDDGSPKVRP